jgi:hypothetical protein
VEAKNRVRSGQECNVFGLATRNTIKTRVLNGMKENDGLKLEVLGYGRSTHSGLQPHDSSATGGL